MHQLFVPTSSLKLKASIHKIFQSALLLTREGKRSRLFTREKRKMISDTTKSFQILEDDTGELGIIK